MRYSKLYTDYAANHLYCEADRLLGIATLAALPHHINSRGANGDIDEPWNLISLSHANHILIHTVGEREFLKRYPDLKNKFDNAHEMLNNWRCQNKS